jgi:uncharacterized membrane protein YeaQ/YmgE (transglycosylase-associated protein family)
VNLSISEIIVWLIVGLLAGTVIGRVVKGTKQGIGVTANLGIGLVGAMIGGFVFNKKQRAKPAAGKPTAPSA